MRKLLKAILPPKIIKWLLEIENKYVNGYAMKSYSQEGEDMILHRIFETKNTGFYIDIGAHHPKRFSNTYFFYKRGWKGINIDAMPGSMKSFRKKRPRDISIEVPIYTEAKIMTYYIFNEPALNGFHAKLSKERETQDNHFRLIKTINLKSKRLDQVLNEYLPMGQNVDFLSVDVEGLDFDVLQSNDWTHYKPEVILVELLNCTITELAQNEVTQFLNKHGYEIYAKTINTVIYKQTTGNKQ